ncbi:MAG TPA: DUF1592 domain-containing protein, partial [Planctomycetaceae bacterium]|nr:DUF1592 domain-containing protein [Planctomycetaceae bacterium]
PKSWLEPVNPLIARQDVRFKLPASPDGQDVTVSLVVSDAGDGNAHDFTVWQQPRLVATGRPDLLLRDVRGVTAHLTAQRARMLARTATYLQAASEAAAAQGTVDPTDLAQRHGLDAAGLRAWLDYLGIGSGGAVELTGHFTTQLKNASGYDFIQGWGSHDTPLLLANSSDQHVRVPGNMRPHSVAVHPSPTLRAAVGWHSPVAATLRLEGAVTHAHPECGNGVTWALELRRGATRRRLATGIAHGAQPVKFGPLENIGVQPGDLVSLLIGPRDGNHSCDLTTVELKLTSGGDDAKTWSLSEDGSGNILAGNPHADRFGNDRVWHFYTEPDKGGETAQVIPAESLLAKWQAATDAHEKHKLAEAVQTLLTSATPAAKDSPDAALQRQLTSLGGPLFGGMLRALPKESTTIAGSEGTDWGLDPALFGKHPDGRALDAASLCVRAPSVIAIRLPADLAAGCELVTTGQLDQSSGAEGSVQLAIVAGQPAREAGLHPSTVTVTNAGGQWTGDNRRTAYGSPILVNDGSAARKRIEAALDEYRQLFPAALCYTKIVPVDEVVTLTLYYREDGHLQRLMLDDAQRAELDRLWDELHYISSDAVTLVDALEQLIQYATQDADPKVFEPLRQPFQDRADAYRQRLIDTEPEHWKSLLDFAGRAYRRPLTAGETQELHQLYGELRRLEFPHDDAFRLTLARVLVAPAFLYRLEQPGPGEKQQPVSDYELASRLSYFLWSSQPDEELLHVAASGKLHHDDVLLAQLKRMLQDPKTKRLASEFAGQWLHIHDFAQHDEKSERHFPSFAAMRSAMAEESVLYFADLFQNDGSVLSILDANHTFLNEDLAKHYGIPGVTGSEWRRVDNVKQHARGGILTQATTLATQSGASRTSPILRGNWLSEVILGEKLPRPPKNVPQLAETPPEGLTERQLIEKHSSDAACAKCHARIDPLGFALENFDAIGRYREGDAAGLRINSETQLPDGTKLSGLDGLRSYLVTKRRDAFVRQFNKKLLGYALGRSVQLSDEPLLSEMQTTLEKRDYRVTAVLERIVLSRQFREIRGREMPDGE